MENFRVKFFGFRSHTKVADPLWYNAYDRAYMAVYREYMEFYSNFSRYQTELRFQQDFKEAVRDFKGVLDPSILQSPFLLFVNIINISW